ncbi:MAG: hypothetical protein AAFZ15_10800 [Bacteroidota bacterium]
MKIQNILPIACVVFFACNSKPSSPPSEPAAPDSPAYNCEVTKAQFLQLDSLVATMQDIDAWGDDAALDSIAELNDAIAARLQKLLACAAVETLDLSGDAFERLYYAQTEDGRIRNFNWYANNGGTWQEMRRIYQYYPRPKVAKATETDYYAGATRFFTLKSDQPMYLGLGADKVCSTCMVEYATLFSFEADTLRRDEVVTLESRMGNLVKFEFDPATQTLKYIMVVDDLNEGWTQDMPKQKWSDLNLDLGNEYEGYEPEADAEVVMGSFVFDGKGFVDQ